MMTTSDAPPPPLPRWRVKFGDEILGPYTLRQLEELVADGRLTPASLVSREGEPGWQPAGEIAELAALLGDQSRFAARPPRVAGNRTADLTMLHVIYGLYAASPLNGLTAIAGVIIAYVKRADMAADWRRTHIEWQIRTFWWGLLFMVVGFLTMFLLIGFLVVALATVWLIYRVVKGWYLLSQYRAIDDPTAWL